MHTIVGGFIKKVRTRKVGRKKGETVETGPQHWYKGGGMPKEAAMHEEPLRGIERCLNQWKGLNQKKKSNVII